jgi:hypothetical protein|tara:strand:- start:118 stop:315 length:198 start_codon:yes stop_codon:yes gene_type:complete
VVKCEYGIVDDFLSKKGLQEKLKSKWADLLIHGDSTILSLPILIRKFLALQGEINKIFLIKPSVA